MLVVEWSVTVVWKEESWRHKFKSGEGRRQGSNVNKLRPISVQGYTSTIRVISCPRELEKLHVNEQLGWTLLAMIEMSPGQCPDINNGMIQS